MKKILKGYTSLVREMLTLPNDASFLSLPAGLAALIAICGIIGLLRNALSVGFDVLPGFYNFQPDILWTTFIFPVHLFLFPGALLHWQLRILGYRRVDAVSIFGLSFCLQILHLIIPFIDWAGLRLGLPPEWEFFTHSVRSEWYTNVLYMTPGIIVGWWITAYIVTRVLRHRLGIGWFAIIFTSLTTFLVILIPTYFIFPTLNTLFNRTFGPWLWSPLDYLFVTPKWFPFWGYGTYFALTALLGLVYYVKQKRHESMKSMIQIKTPGRAHIWLLGFAVARSILDYIWVPAFGQLQYKILVLFNYTAYLYTVYLLIPSVAGFILGRVSSRPVNDRAVLRESVLIWFVYPAVTIINLVTKSPQTISIEWFRHIPTFMVDLNYFPAGFIAVIPVLVVFYTWLMMRHSGAGWLRALMSVLVSLSMVYLLYYQYTLRLFYHFHHQYGPFFAFGFYTLSFLVALGLLAKRFHLTFGGNRVMLPRLVLVSIIISFGLMGFGLIT